MKPQNDAQPDNGAHSFTEAPNPWSFCETPEEKCTMNYCDENGCMNRKRELVHATVHLELFNEHSTIILDVLKERERQNDKFGANRTQHPFLWNTILQEEVGEAAKDSMDIYFSDSPEEAVKRYRKELIEVAAVAIATIQDLDNNGIFEHKP